MKKQQKSKFVYIEHLKDHMRDKGIKGLFYAFIRFVQHTLPYKKIMLFRIRNKNLDKQIEDGCIGVFDTGSYSANSGDNIVMDYCMEHLKEVFSECTYVSAPTHREPSESQCDEMKKAKYKFVCGTNIVCGKMENYYQWMLPVDVSCYKDMCLLGVGWNYYDDNITEYSKDFYKTLLNKKMLHSVRDEYTKSMLERMGVTNVINTGCPTMWKLTPDFCKTIPVNKADNVITTITDYRRDDKNDKIMLELLKKNYKKVYIWLQGTKDREYLSTIIDINEFELIEWDLKNYDEALENIESLDYVGTRLHAGIRALNKKIRSVIVVIDNRAREIAKDTNLTTVERENVESKLEDLILNPFETNIRMPLENINIWKSQFDK